MKGEHSGRERARNPLVQRALVLTRGERTRHRPRLGAMSTSLLDELMTDHLDPGYAAAARRRAETGGRPAGRARAVLALGLLLVGFVLAVAYRGTLRQAPDSERARQALVRDVESGSALSDALQRRAETLSGQLVRERDAALAVSRTGDRASTEVRRLEAAAAQAAVTGPGVEVVVGDAGSREQLDPATGQRVSVPAEDNGRLRDRDLQSLVNALWAAGAEAVAVDGERLAPTTTIRAAGEAILVDLRPVQSPYTIEAVGDPATLLPRFADSEAARRYQSYTGLYGIQFTVRKAGELRLRAATGPELRYAEAVPSTESTPSGSPTPGPGSPAPSRSGSSSGSGSGGPSGSPGRSTGGGP
ncbi:MAG TPA: DUF881 domain-containing protein [Mycobacteriales bacterium]|nr:DUF881 domain-containing protein [Mycobacteriales bacterium]